MKLLTILVFVPVFLFSQVQTISNQKTFGTDSDDYSIIKVYDGFLYSLNTPVNSAISQDKTILGYGLSDAWFVKMDINFNILSQSVYGGSSFEGCSDFEQCANGDFLLLLNSYSGADGNKTISSFGASGTSDIWLLRVNAAGTILWQKSYGGSEFDYPVELLKLNENKFAIVGMSNSPISGNKTVAGFGNYDGWMLFIDGQGNVIDQFVYGGNQLEVWPQASLNDDSTNILLGYISYSGVSGNKTVPPKSGIDAWILTIDTLGNILHQVAYSNGPSSFNMLRDLKFGANNEIFIGLDGEPGVHGDKTVAGYGTIANGNDTWVVKLDENLNELAQYVYGGTSGDGLYSFYRDGSNMILCNGSVSAADGNKTEPAYGGLDNWIVCIDANGNILWQKSAGGSLEENDFLIVNSGPNEYIVASNSFSGISGNKTVPFYVSGVADTWLYKLTTTLSIEKNDDANLFSVAPNPFEDKISFSWGAETQDVQIQIVNATGQIVEIIKNVNDNFYQWSANDLPSGIFYYTISSNQGVSQGKVVKQ